MLRGGPQLSAQDTTHQTKQQQQKQKKRLSFKDPEIEGPQKFYGGCRPKIPSSNLIERRKEASSVENLALEDQAFQIAHHVGSAFSDLSLQETNTGDYFDNTANSSTEAEDSKAEALINDCFLSDASYQKNYQQQSFRISAEDQEFLDDLSPPLQVQNMRCPPAEPNLDSNPYRNSSIPPMEVTEEKYPSSAQHQIQLLKYHLDQQSQQTQLAFHQIQLLTDQVGAENAARKKAQEQNNQLMMQNQELLNHIERLFQQIEELEKQIQFLERSSKVPHQQESQSSQLRGCPPYAGNRRPSGDSTSDRLTHNNYLTPRRNSLSTNKPNTQPQQKQAVNPPQTKLLMNPSQQTQPAPPNRRNPLPTSKPYTSALQNRPTTDTYAKAKDTLHIGDTSPSIQNETANPFGSSWKLKNAPEPDKTAAGRSRTGSFSSFGKLKPPENISAKSNLLSSNSGTAGITGKKYSSSTSDLYNSPSTYQASKPLVIEDGSSSGKSAISSVNVNATTSKLPRFQPYTGSGRRSSLTRDLDQFSVMGKDKFKTSPQTSFYNR